MTRKRANKKEMKSPIATIELAPTQPKIKVSPLNDKDGLMLQEMVNLSNNYAGLVKQQAQYDAMLYMLKMRKEQIKKGEIRLPMMIKVTNTLSYAESDKNKCIKHIENEIKNTELARDGLQGTIEYRRDSYKESLIRMKNILVEKTKGLEITKISSVYTRSKDTRKQEKDAMEKEFKELLKSDEKKEKAK